LGLSASKNGTWPELLSARLGLNVSNLARPGARLADGASQARSIPRDYGVTLVPRSVLAGALALPGHASDGVHLSARGHSWLARRVSEMWLGIGHVLPKKRFGCGPQAALSIELLGIEQRRAGEERHGVGSESGDESVRHRNLPWRGREGRPSPKSGRP